MSFVVWFFAFVQSRFNDRRKWWAFVAFWLSFEYVHFNWDLSWPWLALGNGFAHYPELVQWYEYTGVLGGTLWILLFNIVLYHSIKNKKKYLLSYALLISVFCFTLVSPSELVGDEVDIVVVQPNVDTYSEKFDGLSSLEQIQQFIEVAETQLDTSVDILIGPETAIVNGIWEKNIDYVPEIIQLKKLFVKYPNLQIIIGATTLNTVDPQETLSHSARKFKNSEAYYEVFNSAIHLTPKNHAIYHKSKLVQGVEFIPFSFLLDKISFLTIDLGGIAGSLGKQNKRAVFESSKASFAPIICYESVFGEFTTEYVRNGADIFAIITNDGWWKDTPGYLQHLHYARLRAIENRRAIARSANTGISAFIDSQGTIVQSTQWDEQLAIRQRLKTNTSQTIYVQYGNFIGRISSFIACLFFLFALAKRNSPKG